MGYQRWGGSTEEDEGLSVSVIVEPEVSFLNDEVGN